MTTDTHQKLMRNARIAGFAFLLYIIVGVLRAPTVGVEAIFTLFTCFCALVLAVMLYTLTLDQDRDIAMLALTCRLAEGVAGAIFIPLRLGLQSLTTTANNATNPETLQVIESFLASASRWNPVVAATFFAVGSTLFCWLLLRGRMIPTGLAWLGLAASILLVVALPLRLAGVLEGTLSVLIWLPMAAFEIPLGLWMIVKGIKLPDIAPARAVESL